MKQNWFQKIPKDRIYLVMLLLVGVVFLTVTKSWSVYTDPVRAALRIEKQTTQTAQKPTKKEPITKPVKPSGEEGNEQSEAPETNESVSETQESIPEETEMIPEESIEEPHELVFQTVGDEYFADAVFIGDSRTVGMYEYGGLKDTSTFYATVGLSVHKLFSKKFVVEPDEKNKITVEEALSRHQFSKVYFMMGINEMGIGTADSFLEKYAECVAQIRELQPDAIIYLQGIMQITEKRSAKGDAITKEGIDIRNEGIAALADNEHIFYLEVNEAVCDENGYLISDYSGDGVHLKAQYIDLWKDYLKNHAIVE